MPNKRSIGKLEAKHARNYVHQHLTQRKRDNNPDEITETIFIGTEKELGETVLAEIQEHRTGELPEYPRGLVCFDSQDQGYFNKVTLEEEVHNSGF